MLDEIIYYTFIRIQKYVILWDYYLRSEMIFATLGYFFREKAMKSILGILAMIVVAGLFLTQVSAMGNDIQMRLIVWQMHTKIA